MLENLLAGLWLRFPLALLVARAVVVPLAFAAHEYAHGLTAALLGDPSPRESGRLSLNPFRGMFGLGLLAGLLIGVGWSSPMPIRPHRMKVGGWWGGLLAVLAGPGATVGLALLGRELLEALALKPGLPWGGWPTPADFLTVLVRFNLTYALLNLLPLYPLDAYQAIRLLLPLRAAAWWERQAGRTQVVLGGGLLALLMLPSPTLAALAGPVVRRGLDALLGW